MERAQITLALHVHIFQPPFLDKHVGNQSSVAIIAQRVSKVVESQILDLNLVAMGVETELLRRGKMVELSVMACGYSLKTISDEMAIKMLEQTHKSQIIRRDLLLHVSEVSVAERWIFGRLEERVDSIYADKSLELV